MTSLSPKLTTPVIRISSPRLLPTNASPVSCEEWRGTSIIREAINNEHWDADSQTFTGIRDRRHVADSPLLSRSRHLPVVLRRLVITPLPLVITLLPLVITSVSSALNSFSPIQFRGSPQHRVTMFADQRPLLSSSPLPFKGQPHHRVVVFPVL
jgi:hypothetical protein